MKTKTQLLASVVLVLAACGDNKVAPDARTRPDTGSGSGGFPAAPALGTQIDRMGRPAINTLLNHGFSADATASRTAKDAYNANATPATWISSVPEFMKNLGILDSLDTGFCGNGRCEPNETGGVGTVSPICEPDCGTTNVGFGSASACGNQALYNGGAGGSAMATSYQTLAGVLAGDEVQLDTSKAVCALYLAVEFGVATGAANSTCGGRAPQYDVVDFSLSMTSIGTFGFNPATFAPKLRDNAPAHTDYLGPDMYGTPQQFPFLGNPK